MPGFNYIKCLALDLRGTIVTEAFKYEGAVLPLDAAKELYANGYEPAYVPFIHGGDELAL